MHLLTPLACSIPLTHDDSLIQFIGAPAAILAPSQVDVLQHRLQADLLVLSALRDDLAFLIINILSLHRCEADEGRTQGHIQTPIMRVERSVAAHRFGIRRDSVFSFDRLRASRIDIRPHARADAREQGRAVGRTFRRVHSHQLDVQHVSENLPPQLALRAAT